MRVKIEVNATYRFVLCVLRFLIVLGYLILYKHIWASFNVKYFHYLGYSYNITAGEYVYLSYIIALIPLLFYRNKDKISVFFSVMIYVLAYIPIVLSIRFMQKDMWEHNIISIQVVLMFAMISFFLADRLTFGIPTYSLKKTIRFKSVYFITAVITFILFLAFRNIMRVVSLDQVYDLRIQAKEIQQSGLNGYLLMWATHVFYPLILLFGLFRRKKKIIFLGFALFIFSFSLTALKSNLFLPFIIIALFYGYKFYSKDLLLSILIGIFFTSFLLLSLNDDFFLYKAIFFMRTISISGLLFGIYVDFFTVNDFTYFSHISYVNKLTQSYKYDQDLGRVIGEVYGGGNVNAGFWTTDGYAAYGVLGILFISVIVFIFLVFLNSITRKIDTRYAILLLIPSLLSLLNASFFTFILSCGVFIVIIYFLIGYDVELKNN